jgi:hypothetical protein
MFCLSFTLLNLTLNSLQCRPGKNQAQWYLFFTECQAIRLQIRTAAMADIGGQDGAPPLHGSDDTSVLALNPMIGGYPLSRR